jgi:hypothetical protein
MATTTARVPARLRKACWETWIGKSATESPCWLCEERMIDVWNFHAAHCIPASRDGPMLVANLRPLCATCNLSMGNEDMLSWAERQRLPGAIKMRATGESPYFQFGQGEWSALGHDGLTFRVRSKYS